MFSESWHEIRVILRLISAVTFFCTVPRGHCTRCGTLLNILLSWTATRVDGNIVRRNFHTPMFILRVFKYVFAGFVELPNLRGSGVKIIETRRRCEGVGELHVNKKLYFRAASIFTLAWLSQEEEPTWTKKRCPFTHGASVKNEFGTISSCVCAYCGGYCTVSSAWSLRVSGN